MIYKGFICKIIVLTLIIFTICESGAAAKEESQIKRPFFWEVEKNSKTSHLLGTIHAIVAIDELLCSQDIQHSLENSDLVFVEYDYLLERNKKFVVAGKKLMLSKDGREFQALSGESQEFLRSKGVSEQLNLYGYSKVLHNLCMHGVADVNGLILDNRIAYTAYSKGTSVQELDDFIGDHILEIEKKKADAFNRLSGFKFQLEVGFLNGDIKMFSHNCPFPWYVDKLEHYKLGNKNEDNGKYLSSQGIEQYLNSLTAEKRRDYILELQTRNTQWLDRFEKNRQTHDHIFLAGGLAHLIGPFNLIDMLKEKGYTVKPVTCKK